MSAYTFYSSSFCFHSGWALLNHGVADKRGLVESRYPKSQSTGFEKGNQWQESSPSEAALQRALTLCLALNKDPVVLVSETDMCYISN